MRSRRTSEGLGALACLAVLALAPVWPVPVGFDVIGLFAIAVFGTFLARRALAGDGRLFSLGRVLASALLLIALADGAAGALTEWKLAHAGEGQKGERTREAFDHVFRGGTLGRRFFGTTLLYEEHHYLPFVLNANAPYGGRLQFDGTYHIRRGERIRPRSGVRWRALAIGGSTTFGERLEREGDTWVAQLEQLVRSRKGADCDVINGGVPGYTVNENFIHYSMLLTHLEPDVVILYVGINDVHPRWHTPEIATDYSNFWKPWHGAGTTVPEPIAALRWLRLYRGYFYLRYIEPLAFEGVVILSARDSKGSLTENLQKSKPWVYENHLDNFVKLLIAQGRKVLIVPQYFRVDPQTEAADRVFKRGVDDDNEVDRQVAEREKVPFAGKALTDFVPEDTGDDCHFTARGSSKMAALVYAALEEHGLLP